MKWISATDKHFTKSGLPWFAENGGSLARLPVRAFPTLRPEIVQLGSTATGGRVRFRSNTRNLRVRVAHSGDPCMWNMHRVGNSGIDLYAGKQIWGTTAWLCPEPTYEHTFFEALEGTEREFTLYLPLYNNVTSLEIGLDDHASILPPSPFAVAKPVVFYGSSITQGGCASRPGNAYPAMIGRQLNLDSVNLGFSGNGLGEPEMARLVAEVDAACFVLDFHINVATPAELRAVYLPFYDTVRASHPDTPIVMLSQIFQTREWTEPRAVEKRHGQTAVIRETLAEAIKRGDRNVHFVDGTWLIGPEAEGAFVDGVHPNDLGFQMMADGLAPVLRSLLIHN